MREHAIPAGAEGLTLGRYIRRAYPMCSMAMLKKALARRDFRQDGLRMSETDIVHAGHMLRCYISDEYLTGAPLEVIYNSGGMAGIVKPAGLSCQRDADGIGEDTVEARIRELFGEAYLVNRLDHFTGGVMPVALNEAVRAKLLEAFRLHSVKKTYVCQVVGRPPAPYARLVNYAVKSASESRVHVYDAPRSGALTMALTYELLEAGVVSRLRVQLETGRTHQIRAQLAHAGMPVLGDDRYGNRTVNRRHSAAFQRLWCEAIEFSDGIRLFREAPF